jgi:hypothetical protein
MQNDDFSNWPILLSGIPCKEVAVTSCVPSHSTSYALLSVSSLVQASLSAATMSMLTHKPGPILDLLKIAQGQSWNLWAWHRALCDLPPPYSLPIQVHHPLPPLPDSIQTTYNSPNLPPSSTSLDLGTKSFSLLARPFSILQPHLTPICFSSFASCVTSFEAKVE